METSSGPFGLFSQNIDGSLRIPLDIFSDGFNKLRGYILVSESININEKVLKHRGIPKINDEN